MRWPLGRLQMGETLVDLTSYRESGIDGGSDYEGEGENSLDTASRSFPLLATHAYSARPNASLAADAVERCGWSMALWLLYLAGAREGAEICEL